MLHMNSEAAMVAAVLHDVVEDSDWTIERLRARGFSEEVLHAVDCLTKREGEDYEGFITRARQDPIARQVKIADLEDNMDIRRMEKLSAEDLENLDKYHRAWLKLTSSGSRGGEKND